MLILQHLRVFFLSDNMACPLFVRYLDILSGAVAAHAAAVHFNLIILGSIGDFKSKGFEKVIKKYDIIKG